MKFKSNAYYILVSLEDESFINDTYKSIIERRCLFMNIHSEYISFNSAHELSQIIENIILSISIDKFYPHIHLECHGSVDGIKLKNNIRLSWEYLSECFLKVNAKCGNNLVVTMAACYGAYFNIAFLNKIDVQKECRAPVFAIIGPDYQTNYGELQAGYNEFFNNFLISRNLKQAFIALKNEQTQKGKLIIKTCDDIFRSVISSYIDIIVNPKFTNKENLKEEVDKIEKMFFYEYQRKVTYKQRSKLFDKLSDKNEYLEMINDIRIKYFWIDKFPENDKRFSKVELNYS